MSDVRLVHTIAAVVNGLALAGALLGLPRLSIVCCVLSALLLIWSAEKLRFHLVTKGDRP